MRKEIRIVIADDHQLIIDGIKGVLSNESHFKLIGEIGNGADLLTFLEIIVPDVVLLDVNLPKLNGLDVLREIKKSYPDLKVVILSVHEEQSIILKAMKLGAEAYLLKRSDPNEIVRAIETVASGGKYFSTEVNETLAQDTTHQYQRTQSSLALIETMTSREREILNWIVAGFSNQRIADKLSISRRTVDTHRNNLMQKLDIHSTVELIKFALKHKL